MQGAIAKRFWPRKRWRRATGSAYAAGFRPDRRAACSRRIEAGIVIVVRGIRRLRVVRRKVAGLRLQRFGELLVLIAACMEHGADHGVEGDAELVEAEFIADGDEGTGTLVRFTSAIASLTALP